MIGKLAEYRKVRDEYMVQHPKCEFEGCNANSQDLHHRKGRGENISKKEYFMAVCRLHHNFIHENDKESRAKGYLLSRL